MGKHFTWLILYFLVPNGYANCSLCLLYWIHLLICKCQPLMLKGSCHKMKNTLRSKNHLGVCVSFSPNPWLPGPKESCLSQGWVWTVALYFTWNLLYTRLALNSKSCLHLSPGTKGTSVFQLDHTDLEGLWMWSLARTAMLWIKIPRHASPH